jgi:hypothetical protein
MATSAMRPDINAGPMLRNLIPVKTESNITGEGPVVVLLAFCANHGPLKTIARTITKERVEVFIFCFGDVVFEDVE